MGWMARSKTKVWLGWRWWCQYRRWARMQRVQVHWATHRPMAPHVPMAWRGLALGGWLLVLLHGVGGPLLLDLVLGAVAWAALSGWQRWLYRPLLKALNHHGQGWHQVRVDAREAAVLAQWRYRAYRWRSGGGPGVPDNAEGTERST